MKLKLYFCEQYPDSLYIIKDNVVYRVGDEIPDKRNTYVDFKTNVVGFKNTEYSWGLTYWYVKDLNNKRRRPRFIMIGSV